MLYLCFWSFSLLFYSSFLKNSPPVGPAPPAVVGVVAGFFDMSKAPFTNLLFGVIADWISPLGFSIF
jgi:hypothetical protein